jgi:hypothetical protein
MTNSHKISEGFYMIIYPNLNQILVERGISITNLAEGIGINEVVLDKKLRGLLPLKLHEAIRIGLYLNHPDMNFLFVQLDINT